MTEDPFLGELETALERIRTREDLAEFVDLLDQRYQEGKFEEQSVSDYLGGLYGLLDALDGWMKNRGLEEPKQPSWKLMGELLLAAFYHS